MTKSDTPFPPEPGRPEMPADYGISPKAEGLLTWEWVREQMTHSRNYWISTIRPDGRPHAMPVWGVWLDDTLFFGTSRKSRKALNLAANPAVSVTTESGDHAVIIEGVVEEVTDRNLFDRYTAAVAEKYPGMPTAAEPDPNTITFSVRKQSVFAFRERDFPQTATRWRY